ncbi:hypothetical protein [Nocardia sp. XZ_19_385]|uniref:hypothetical protein n=1 Tax=Nocardia sp. XZ_19_385 TaxID=2769488 RepID=UPI00189023FE|nr:hypothetical protein [Nocardia sp. XZ_19_385]
MKTEEAQSDSVNAVEPEDSKPEAAPSRALALDADRVDSGRRSSILVAVAAILAVVAVFCGAQWRSAANETADLRAAAADEQRATEIARDYVKRSLTYDYRNLDAFFGAVTDGTGDTLRERYKQVRETLGKIMTESQVVASGNAVSAAVDSVTGDQYRVTVFAIQRTQNVQQKDPASVPNLLTVTVAKNGGAWQVTDYGPQKVAP